MKFRLKTKSISCAVLGRPQDSFPSRPQVRAGATRRGNARFRCEPPTWGLETRAGPTRQRVGRPL
jgi:hypothetical protein